MAKCRYRQSDQACEINITPTGFKIAFTKPVDAATGKAPKSYKVGTFTHKYHAAYGGPEVDQTAPTVKSVTLSPDGLTATLVLDTLTRGHVHEPTPHGGTGPLLRSAFALIRK